MRWFSLLAAPLHRVVTFYAMLGILLGGLPLLSLAGCGGGGGDGGGSLSPDQQRIQTYNQAFEEYRESMLRVAARAEEMEALAAGSGGALTEADAMAHGQALSQWSLDYRAALAASQRMTRAAQAMEAEQQTSGLRFGVAGTELEQAFQAELFTLTGILLLTAGVSVSTWLACKKTGESLTKACRDIRNIVTVTQNQDCLDAYGDALEMDVAPPVSKEAILEFIEKDPGRAEHCTKAAFSIQLMVTEGSAGASCQAPKPEDVKATQFEVTQDVVETGANYSVSMTQTVTGTPVSVMVQGSKLSEAAKTTTEIGMLVTDTAMQEYGNTLPDEVTVVGVSDDKTTVDVPQSSSQNTPEQALAVLEDPLADAAALDEALDDVLSDVVNTGKLPYPTTGIDGSKSVDVPNNIFVGSYGVPGLASEVTVPIPNIGFATVMVLSPETVPEVKENVDTSQPATIDLGSFGISDWGEEPGKKKEEEPDPPTGDGGLTIKATEGPYFPGMSIVLTVDCPAQVVFPATLTSNTLSGVSIYWASFDACPMVVYVDADSAGSYTILLTLTDDGGKKYQGSITLDIAGSGSAECQMEEFQACLDGVFNDSSCWGGCPPESEDRDYQACSWRCSAEKAYADVQCAYESDCAAGWAYLAYRKCTASCNFAYAACLEAIESDDPAYLGGCPSTQGACLGQCTPLIP